MKRFKNILLVYENKTNTQALIDRAESLAKANAACVTILSVVNNSISSISIALSDIPSEELFALLIKERQAQVDTLVSTMKQKDIDASAKVLNGTPFLEIIRQVLRNKHDLVIISAEGKGGLKERLFGSTSMHLMRKCPCPVWVVKPTKQKNYQHILASVDTTNDYPDQEQEQITLNPLIIQLASSMARINQCELHVVQVWSVFAEGYMSVRGGVSDKAIKELRTSTKKNYLHLIEKLLAGVDLENVPVFKHILRSEDVSKSILSFVKNKAIARSRCCSGN